MKAKMNLPDSTVFRDEPKTFPQSYVNSDSNLTQSQNPKINIFEDVSRKHFVIIISMITTTRYDVV